MVCLLFPCCHSGPLHIWVLGEANSSTYSCDGGQMCAKCPLGSHRSACTRSHSFSSVYANVSWATVKEHRVKWKYSVCSFPRQQRHIKVQKQVMNRLNALNALTFSRLDTTPYTSMVVDISEFWLQRTTTGDLYTSLHLNSNKTQLLRSNKCILIKVVSTKEHFETLHKLNIYATTIKKKQPCYC